MSHTITAPQGAHDHRAVAAAIRRRRKRLALLRFRDELAELLQEVQDGEVDNWETRTSLSVYEQICREANQF